MGCTEGDCLCTFVVVLFIAALHPCSSIGLIQDYDLYEEELKRSLTPTLRSDLCYHIYKEAAPGKLSSTCSCHEMFQSFWIASLLESPSPLF